MEEAWPSLEHVTDPMLFYCADGDPERMKAHVTQMIDEITAFVDLEHPAQCHHERMDTEVMTQKWSRDELEQAHQHYMETASRCAASGEWRDWADLFTEDAVYLEHMFGTFHGPRRDLRLDRPAHGRVAEPGHDLVPARVVRVRRGAGLVGLPDREPDEGSR